MYIVPTCYIEPYSTAIEIIFQLDSSRNLGLLAHGYEVAVWQEERENSMTLISVHYFPTVELPTYRVTVSGLTSNMMYLVQVRANGSHIPNMKSAWVETRIQTLTHGEHTNICSCCRIYLLVFCPNVIITSTRFSMYLHFICILYNRMCKGLHNYLII